MKLLTVSPSPHIHGDKSVSRLMFDVVIALIPALAASIYFFGIGALIVTLTSVASALIFEYLITKYLLKREPSLMDGSALVTGLLLAFNVPANLPFWMVMIGALVAIGIGKMSFGGLGNNPFNPALVGRVFLLVSFPVKMTTYPEPIASRLDYVDAVTGPTPLTILNEGMMKNQPVNQIMEKIPDYNAMFLGNMGGSLGEIAGIALIIGFIYLLIRKVITWHIPVVTLATIAVFTGILWLADPTRYADPLFHIITGGALLGAIYMATDYSTSPMSKKGAIVYAIGIGILTVVIRIWGAYPEGISFAILLMNGFVPLINKYMKPKLFGELKTALKK